MGINTFVAPIEMPFVVKAEPTSKSASVNDTPIVVKITAKTTRTRAKRRIMIGAERYSLLPFELFSIKGCCSSAGMTFSFISTLLTLSFTDFAKATSLETRMPPAMENVQPPMSMSTIKMDNRVLLSVAKGMKLNPVEEDMLTTWKSESSTLKFPSNENNTVPNNIIKKKATISHEMAFRGFRVNK